MDVNNQSISNIINYWVDVELSSPPIIKTNNATKKSDVKWHQKISFKYDNDVIWMHPLREKIDNADDWVHRIYLGIFNTEIVIEEFSKDTKDINELKSKHNTCLVSFLIDGKGMPIKDTIIIPEYLSYIAYAKINDETLSRSFEERIKDIYATWSFTILKNKNNLEKDDLNDLIKQILIELNWDLLAEAYINDVFIALGYTESLSITKNRNLKFDSEINHSLIANDLKKVSENIKEGVSDNALQYYLNPYYDFIDKTDILKDKNAFREGLSPSKMSPVAWPTTNNHYLVSSQQFAVNKIIGDLGKEQTGMFSVNGPPGTGKTTLLREVIANIIYQRALVLMKFKNNPKDAFFDMGKITYKFSDKGNKTIYGLNEEITGYEIVVASSNNGAVQNITHELPLMDNIDKKWHDELVYMKEIAKNMNGKKESWGAISATLGNKNNNYNFISNFLFSNTNDDGDSTRSVFEFLKNAHYFKNENVLSWSLACEKFEKQKKRVDKITDYLDKLEYALNNVKINKEKAKEFEDIYKKTQNEVKIIQKKIKDSEKEYQELKIRYDKETEKYLKLKKQKNNFFNKIFNRNAKEDQEKVIRDYRKEIERLKRNHQTLVNSKKTIFSNYQEAKFHYQKQISLVNQLVKINEDFGKKLSDEVPVPRFWNESAEIVQKASPWLNEKLYEERVKLFIASMNLHKSFIVENSEFISNNLYSLKDVLDNEFYEKDIYVKAIWQTLFLVIPVVSTTFSSLGNLFDYLKSGSLGWILIDEAGQSTPQAPIGGLWRSKKAVVVGDPLQVEPVVNIEKKLSEVLLEKNDVSMDWNTCNYSAQQIADRNNKWGTNIKIGRRDIWVGSPLRVHRRCDEPMFSISNKIAYNDMMIYGKPDKDTEGFIKKELGETRWIAINGFPEKDSHFIQEEGAKLIEMLKQLTHSEKVDYVSQLPNLYIISPFKSVSFEINRLLKKERNNWMNKKSNIDDKTLNAWINSSVGTIHSFQGKEADAVILVLGGNIAKPSAITWVCEEPNILNVATTRAKKSFYMIGDPSIWNKGVFGLLKDLITIDKASYNDADSKEKMLKEEEFKENESDDDLGDFMNEDIDLTE